MLAYYCLSLINNDNLINFMTKSILLLFMKYFPGFVRLFYKNDPFYDRKDLNDQIW